MRTVSSRTGLSASLLRAWERRHGLLEPQRTEGGHRLYTDDDLRVLEQVQRLLREGRAIGEIATLGRPALLGMADERRATAGADLGSQPAELVRRLADAAVAIDERAVEEVLDEAFGLRSVPVALEQVIEPGLVQIGALWAAGRCSVSGEHMASTKVLGRLLKLLETANPAAESGAPVAVAAAFPDERHEIGALVAAHTLTRHGYRVVYLGSSLPVEALERACRLLEPALVCLSVTRSPLLETHAPQLAELAGRLPDGVRVLVGGQGCREVPASLEGSRVELLLPAGLTLEQALATAPRR